MKLNNTLLSKFVSFFSSKPTCLIPSIKQKSKNAIILGKIIKSTISFAPAASSSLEREFKNWCNVGKDKRFKTKKIGYFKRRCWIPRAEKLFQVAVEVVEQEPTHDFQELRANFRLYQLMNNRMSIACVGSVLYCVSSVQTVKDSKANLNDQFIYTPLQITLQLLSIHSAFSLPFRVLRTFYHHNDR